MPHEHLKKLQESGSFTELMMFQEEIQTLPFGAVWEAYCNTQNVPENEGQFKTVCEYEKIVLKERA